MSTLTVTTVQTNIEWLNIAANLAALDDKLAPLAQTDLILLPETFATGFAINLDCEVGADGGQILSWLKQTAKQKGAVVAGSALVAHQGKKANRFYWVWPNGDVAFYDKRHLFRLGNEGDHVVAGTERQIFTINGVRILPIVCYDLRFPVWSRSRNDYDVLVNVANWPAARRDIWDTLLMARAIENQSYVIGINRIGDDGNGVAHSGGTAVYDFVGKPLYRAPDNNEALNTITIDIEQLNAFKAGFPAYLDADDFQITV